MTTEPDLPAIISTPEPPANTLVEWLRQFTHESLAIEGITRPPTDTEVGLLLWMFERPRLAVKDVRFIVSTYQPDAKLRCRPGMGVGVGDYTAPPGGRDVTLALTDLLRHMARHRGDEREEWRCYLAYEDLHPFSDGNGRSGRALWLWMMQPRYNFFLQEFHYQTLRYASRDYHDQPR